jgi:hypothetical protein
MYPTDNPQTDSQSTNSRSLSPPPLLEHIGAEHLLNTTSSSCVIKQQYGQLTPLPTPRSKTYNTLFQLIVDRQAVVNGECHWQLGNPKWEAPHHPEQRWQLRMENTAQ